MTGELNHRDEFEAILQEALGEEATQAESHVWENIESALTEEKKRRGVIWWTWGLAAGIALLAGLFLVQNQLQPSDLMVDRQSALPLHETQPGENSSTSPAESNGANHEDNQDNLLPDSQNTANHGSGNNNSLKKKKSAQDWSGTVKVRATEDPVPMALMNKLKSIKLDDNAFVSMTKSDIIIDDILDDPTPQPQGWSLGGNIQSGNSSSDAIVVNDSRRGYTASGSNILAVDESSSADIKSHQVPFTFGVMAGYQLNKRLNLNSGLSYSRLVSTWGEADVAHKQQSHYIGIPAILNWEFLQSKKFKMYSSSGLLFEHGLGSSMSTTMTINGAKSIQKYKEPTPGFQGGVMAGFGMEYVIGKNVGLYLQPAVTTWVVNVNQPATIRTSQTFSPTLQMGARFQIK